MRHAMFCVMKRYANNPSTLLLSNFNFDIYFFFLDRFAKHIEYGWIWIISIEKRF